MRFDWDRRKAVENRKKHRVSFEEASTIFADMAILTMHDDEHSLTEERWASIGRSMLGGILVVIHTWPQADDMGDELVRIISSRRANKREQAMYMERSR
jgi:uncharacterized protein